MKSTGVVRRIDELGRIVLPIEIRKNLSLSSKDTVEIFVEGDTIILKKYEPSCVFCGSVENTSVIKDRMVCKKCLADIQKANID